MVTDEDLRRELTAAFHEEADPIARTAIESVALLGRQAATDTGEGARWYARGR